MLSAAGPAESRYLTRLILGELRLGVGDGIIRDAIAKAFNVEAPLVEHAFNLSCDIGEVASKAKSGGKEALEKITIEPGKPMKVMLAQKKAGIAQAVEDLGKCAYEVKYDGARVQVHKKGKDVVLYTRRLENVTHQFPEVVEQARENIRAKEAIIEGEVVAIEMLGSRKPRPFQDLSRRIKRKYDILEISEKIPIEVNLFDVVYAEGESLLDMPFGERRKILRKMVTPSSTFMLADQIITEDVNAAEQFYEHALKLGHEGVMAKLLDAPYKPGSRVGYMYKVKPLMETLDLTVVGATWGEGRRAQWLGSFLLAVFDPATAEYHTIGRMGTGLTDEKLQEFTDTLKPKITRQDGKEVSLTPFLVVEVAYEEIQKSSKYESGFALRFPRLVRVREDRGPEEADSLERVMELMRK